MGQRKVTIQDIKQAKKDHKKIIMVTAYDYPFGLMADEAGVDIVLVGDSLGMVVMGLDGTVGVTMDQMIHHIQAVVRGCNAIVKAGIPVQGHIGLTPQTASALGGFKMQGKDAQAAKRIIEDARALEEAGVFSMILEAVPAPLGEIIAQTVSIPVIGIGAGSQVDGQVLVTHDMIGLFDKFVPKFVKQYALVRPTIIDALKTFKEEVT
ncbi:MAG: 3-methyl-2-oxobutanoate hydroxymethyltransferase, partial [Desulfobacteraceae bacterium 4572_89]